MDLSTLLPPRLFILPQRVPPLRGFSRRETRWRRGDGRLSFGRFRGSSIMLSVDVSPHRAAIATYAHGATDTVGGTAAAYSPSPHREEVNTAGRALDVAVSVSTEGLVPLSLPESLGGPAAIEGDIAHLDGVPLFHYHALPCRMLGLGSAFIVGPDGGGGRTLASTTVGIVKAQPRVPKRVLVHFIINRIPHRRWPHEVVVALGNWARA